MKLIIMTECFVASFDGDFSKKKKKKKAVSNDFVIIDSNR